MRPRSSELENHGADRREAVKAEATATATREGDHWRREGGVRGIETEGDEDPTETNIEKRAGRDVLSPVLSPSRTYNGSKQRPREQIRHEFKYNTDSLASRQFGEWGCGVAEATPKRPLLLTSAHSRG